METNTQHGILFLDFDGVIVQSQSVYFDLFSEHFPDVSQQEFLELFDGNFQLKIVEQFAPEQIESFREYFRKEYPRRVRELEPISGMKEFLVDSIPHVVIAIVTSNVSDVVWDFIQDYGLSSTISHVLGSEGNVSKVEKFRQLSRQYRLRVEEELAVSDTVGDLREANRIGVSTIAATWGFHSHEHLLRARPSFIADDVQDLQSYVQHYFHLSA